MKRVFKVSEIIRILLHDGWFLVRQVGSHRQYHHPVKKGTTTVRGKLSDDVEINNLKDMQRQSGIKFN